MHLITRDHPAWRPRAEHPLGAVFVTAPHERRRRSRPITGPAVPFRHPGGSEPLSIRVSATRWGRKPTSRSDLQFTASAIGEVIVSLPAPARRCSGASKGPTSDGGGPPDKRNDACNRRALRLSWVALSFRAGRLPRLSAAHHHLLRVGVKCQCGDRGGGVDQQSKYLNGIVGLRSDDDASGDFSGVDGNVLLTRRSSVPASKTIARYLPSSKSSGNVWSPFCTLKKVSSTALLSSRSTISISRCR